MLKWYIYKLGHAGCRAARPKDCCATYSQLEHRLQIHLKRYIIELGHAGCRAALIEDCRATYSRLEHQLQIHLQVHFFNNWLQINATTRIWIKNYLFTVEGVNE
ncbi:hypothetical protein QVD17_38162 [Tagetes erecta]|uniref:Uncharacterized protein n=1 Tax=Tagetes erecta TaxID=13708 RepID=A0AAD8JW10_TARER|nr:hypothetical protein QVD17_38162 [Tagetes erecta]